MGTQGVPSKKETTMTEVTALFPTRSEAERATEELMARGYDPGRVGYIDRHRDEHGEIITDEGYVDDSGEVAEEATKGAAGVPWEELPSAPVPVSSHLPGSCSCPASAHSSQQGP
jgi:hypothetical protein